MNFLLPLATAVMLAVTTSAPAFELPAASQQCLVGITDGWDSTSATLRLYQKSGTSWKPVAGPWKTRLGKMGLAWGIGLHPVPRGASTKREGDWKSPAGVFSIGGVWGYQPAIQKHPKLPYVRITPRHLWVEDPESPSYNRGIVLDHDPASAWEKKQQMRQNDPAHALKLFIAHNAPNRRGGAIPYAGSSIFFHIWRSGGTKPTAGCTAMPENDLRSLIARLDPTLRPVYVLLPKAEYDKHRKSWKLP